VQGQAYLWEAVAEQEWLGIAGQPWRLADSVARLSEVTLPPHQVAGMRAYPKVVGCQLATVRWGSAWQLWEKPLGTA
jgi:hypothetical protein